MIYYEPVNLKQWNMFEKVSGAGHVEPFLATKSMKYGDVVLLHVGQQDSNYKSGVYAFGAVVEGPFILKNHPDDYCNEKNTVMVRIDKIDFVNPLVSHNECLAFIHQFRTVHRINPAYYEMITKMLKLNTYL